MNVLVEDRGDRLLFAHQPYLDYLTAVRVLQDVLAGSRNVLGWLLADDQSLFRRGQLRQLLALLRDDDPERYLESMREILGGEKVRFHLKHLALQVLGHADAPMDGEVDLVLELLGKPEWVDHVFFQVLAGREAWFDMLYGRGVLQDWLADRDESRVKFAINLIERVVATRGETVELLLLDRSREGWQRRLEAAIWRTSPEQLSDGLFDALVDLTRQGSTGVRDFVDWKRLAEAAPGRCFRLLEARIESDLGRFEAMLGGGAGNRVGRDDSSLLIGQAALARAAAAMPVEAWDRLMPRFREANRLSVAVRRRTRRGAWNDLLFDLGQLARRTKHMLRVILTEAGKAMAPASPDSFWDHVASESPGTRSIDQLLARCITYGPEDRADAAICWLLANPLRLRCGTGDRGSVYRPAWRLLRRYAGHCSDALFAELQAAILAHRPEVERESYKLYHNRQRREEFWGEHSFDVLKCNDLGLGQYLLLSALPPDRLPPVVRDWAGVLRRKFGPPKLLLKKTPRRSGGRVGSTIPHDRLHLLSDDQWLGIIRGHWPQRSHRWKPMGSDAIGEASVEMFARDLGHMAGRQPHRFARLAQQMPRDADPRYVTAILHALGATSPPTRCRRRAGGPPRSSRSRPSSGGFRHWKPTASSPWPSAGQYGSEVTRSGGTGCWSGWRGLRSVTLNPGYAARRRWRSGPCSSVGRAR